MSLGAGCQDCGRQAGAGDWCGSAHRLHLLLPHGVQCKAPHTYLTTQQFTAVCLCAHVTVHQTVSQLFCH